MKNQKLYIRECEKEYQNMLLSRVEDKNSFWYGQIIPGKYNYRWSYFVAMVVLYTDENAAYYKDESILKNVKLYTQAVLREQLPSGFVSLFDCNIDSPPDTAFGVIELALCYQLIQKCGFPELDGVLADLEAFLRKAANGLCTGGIHTPNHRWVIGCALSLCYELFQEEGYRDRVFAFLQEGLDINSYGEWTEKSNAIYNSVCNLYLFHIGRIFQLDYIFEAITRNLKMMQFLLHPDDSIVTEYSTRQDRAKRMYLDERYAIIYSLMADKKRDGELAFMAEKAIKTTNTYASLLLYGALFPTEPVAAVPVSDRYQILLNEKEKERGGFGDCVLRHRQGDFSLTVMEGQKDFLFLQYGNARLLGMRFVFGWFGVAAVSFDSLTKTGVDQYLLETTLTGSYLDVLSEEKRKGKPEFAPFEYENRAKTAVLQVSITIQIQIHESGMDLIFRCTDMPHLCAQVVCLFDREGEIEGAPLVRVDEHNSLLPEGGISFRCGEDVILLDGGCNEHVLTHIRNYTTDLNAQNVLINYITPFEKKISIKCDKMR